jgi:hypothetical protein
MRLSWRWLGRAILLLCLLLVTGCSGVNATGTVNPLMFLVPGLGQAAPETLPKDMPDTPTETGGQVRVFAQSN